MNLRRTALTQILLGLIAILLLALLAVLLLHREKHGAPNIDGLTQALRKSAETALPAPTIASEQIKLIRPEADLDTVAETVVRAASQHGGTALKTPGESGGFSVLVQISGKEAARFRELVTGKTSAVVVEAEGNQIIEVIVSK